MRQKRKEDLQKVRSSQQESNRKGLINSVLKNYRPKSVKSRTPETATIASSGGLFEFKWPRQESNLNLELRKLLYYPLYYEAIFA